MSGKWNEVSTEIERSDSKPADLGRCLQFMGPSQNEDVMTSNKCFKYNHQTKPQKAYTCTYE